MPAAVVPVDAIALGPGYLYYAPLATTLPANTVTASVFTDVWGAGWSLLGGTENGHELLYDLAVDEVDVEEYLEPVKYITKGRKSGIKFELAQIHATNLKRAMNGGTITVTGTAGTTMSKLSPPALGAEVRCLIGWESTDNTERLIGYQCLQIGSIAMKRQKGAAKATIPVEFRFEQPTTGGDPFNYFSAGTIRG